MRIKKYKTNKTNISFERPLIRFFLVLSDAIPLDTIKLKHEY